MRDGIMAEATLLHENVCQALADPKRIVILYLLADGPRHVGEIAAELDAPQSTVSRHLRVLRERSLVTTEREGAQIVYSLKDHRIIDALDLMRAMVMSSLRERGRLADSLQEPAPGSNDVVSRPSGPRAERGPEERWPA
jgi:DNA-binding transcriptional ArsR family regulator